MTGTVTSRKLTITSIHKNMNHITIIPFTVRMKWAVNTFIIKHTSPRVIRKFREGKYLDALSPVAHRRGCLSRRHTLRLVRRCLNTGEYYKDSQSLNDDPLAQTFLEAYYSLQ